MKLHLEQGWSCEDNIEFLFARFVLCVLKLSFKDTFAVYQDTELKCENEARLEAERMLMKPVVMFGPFCTKDLSKQKTLKALPANVKLLTLEKWSDEKSVLIRLENVGMVETETVPLPHPVRGRTPLR